MKRVYRFTDSETGDYRPILRIDNRTYVKHFELQKLS